ncbi:MAG: hypothetical protein EBR81_17130, partial [Proteobacteria bacterium]|nr:hypothetical protein [Pseudomonadota bacterium]
KAEGSEVKAGEPLAQVELTEPTLPVEAPVSGMLVKIGVPAKGAAIPGSPIGAVRVLGHVDLFGKKGYGVHEQPPVNTPVGDVVGYHIRTGIHDVVRYDWEQYLTFASRHFGL